MNLRKNTTYAYSTLNVKVTYDGILYILTRAGGGDEIENRCWGERQNGKIFTCDEALAIPQWQRLVFMSLLSH